MSTSEDNGVPIGVAIRTFCAKHEAPFREKNANQPATMLLMMGKLSSIITPSAAIKSAGDIAERFQAFAKEDKPICCAIGDEGMAEILAKVPQTTGNAARDEEIALMLEPSAGRERRYPKVKQSVDLRPMEPYVLTLSHDPRGGGKLIAVISSGHPDVDADVEIYDLERVDDERAARGWFAQQLESKPWIPKS